MNHRKGTTMKHHIFDLDHTVIDSSHRQRLLPNGDLDLDHWIANRASRDLVMADRLLPFAHYWRALGQPVAVCTSRVISHLEHEFLAMHHLPTDYFSSRNDGDWRPDAEFKVAKIAVMLDRKGWNAEDVTLYDDHDGVRAAVSKTLGIRTFNPVPYNRRAA
jgi:hypothetical protein